ncbi:MAG: AMIN domain-containing protein, partial [Spirochaetia bacterium]|nr:AMIN domain-containing protein [Spirochaetia bacterium]
MKPFTKVGFMSLIVLAMFVLMPFSYADDEEDFINVSPVEKKDTGEMMDSEAVSKAEKTAPTAVVQTGEEKPAVQTAAVSAGLRVEKVITVDLSDRVEVRIITSAPVKYKATELDPPPNPRILLQINNCEVTGDTKPAGIGNVDKIRTAPHNTTAWIVVDLKQKSRWSVSASGSRITVSVPKTQTGRTSAQTQVKTEAPAESGSPAGSMIYRVIEVASKNIGKKTRTIVTTDGPVKYRVKKDATGKTITLGIIGAVSIWQKGSLTVGESTVKNVSLRENSADKTVDVTIALSENVPYTVTRDQNQVVIDVDNLETVGKKVKKKLDLYQKISLNVQDASLTGILRLLSTQTGFEFSVSPSVTKATPITIREDDKTLNRVLKDILMPQNLYFEVVDGVIKIGDIGELKQARQLQTKRSKYYTPRTMKAEELKAMLDSSIAKEPLMDVVIQIDRSQGISRLMMFGVENDIDRVTDMISGLDAGGGSDTEAMAEGGYKTKIFKLQYIYPSTVVETVKAFLSTDGKVLSDDRSGNLIITDNVTYLKKVESIIKKLDVKLRQVIIEAKLYEVNVGALHDIGVNWKAESQSGQPHI